MRTYHICVYPTCNFSIIILTCHNSDPYAFIGNKPWSAANQRYYITKYLFNSGYDWMFYLDADAFISNIHYNIRRFVSKYPNKAFLFCRGGMKGTHTLLNNIYIHIYYNICAHIHIVIFYTRIHTLWYIYIYIYHGIYTHVLLHTYP